MNAGSPPIVAVGRFRRPRTRVPGARFRLRHVRSDGRAAGGQLGISTRPCTLDNPVLLERLAPATGLLICKAEQL